MISCNIKEKMEKTKQLWNKKYETQYPCAHKTESFEGADCLLDFALKSHTELHALQNKVEPKCEHCILQGPLDVVDDLMTILMVGADPVQEQYDQKLFNQFISRENATANP